MFQKYPNQILFDCDFGCVVALSYLIGKLGQSGNTQKKTSVSVLGRYTLTREEKLFAALVHLERSGCGELVHRP